ncbi:MAG: DUF6468 domain-containing protein [Bdellovibrionales bacterium]
MGDWLRLALDAILIVCVGAGLVQATRLIRYLSNLRENREGMERFIREFNATVSRAETGLKELRYAARESGDDLEKLVEKAVMVRDELQFLVESADQIADRLSQSATQAVQSGEQNAEIIPLSERRDEPTRPAAAQTPATETRNEPRQKTAMSRATALTANPDARRPPSATAPAQPSAAVLSTLAAKIADARSASKVSPAAASRAEQELLQALQNLR